MSRAEEMTCPICGQENHCESGKEEPGKQCWCCRETFPEGIFALVPAELQRKACICKNCLDHYTRSMKSN